MDVIHALITTHLNSADLLGLGPFATASANTMRPPATAPALVADGEPPPPYLMSTPALGHQLLFKKHKVLPHPRKEASYAALRASRPRVALANHDLSLTTSASFAVSSDDASITNSQASSPRTTKQYPKTLGNGPDLPPTPPAHSRNSSSTYSVLPSSATYVQSPERSAEDVQLKPQLPTTPTKQMSPPTPDVTPPDTLEQDIHKEAFPPRPIPERNLSKCTTDSRTESFKTARESPVTASSDDDARYFVSKTVPQPAPVSARTSESTVRRLPSSDDEQHKSARKPKAVGLGLGLESSPESITPQSTREFVSFDGEWRSGKEQIVTDWHNSLARNVIVRNHLSDHRAGESSSRSEVVEHVIVTPTNATKALRSMPLPHRILTFPSPDEAALQPRAETRQQQNPQVRQRQGRSQTAQQHHNRQSEEPPLASAALIYAHVTSSSTSSASDKGPAVSSVSSRSTISTVVEAVLYGTPPQRRRTLRHVKKQVGLRNSGLDLSPTSSAATSLLEETSKRRPNGTRLNHSGHDSVVSTSTINSISSRSARREIWKAGGIPVVVVPSRLSSVRSSSREPSLRSTSSRRSRRSQSLNSAPLSQLSKSTEASPSSDKRRRRGRAYSESTGSARDGSAPGDQRTLDFPPSIPRRTSSLSAPTSRNASRSGSLTAESLSAHSALLKSRLKDQEPVRPRAESQEPSQPPKIVQPTQDQPEQLRQPEVDKAMVSMLSGANRSGSEHRDSALILSDWVKNVSKESIMLHRTKTENDALHEKDERRSRDTGHSDDAYEYHLDPRSSLDRHLDRNSARHLSPHNTPFSMVSVETTTTHHSQAEVSEALAVSIYPHQNTSVLVVDHSTRPSDSSEESQLERSTASTVATRTKPVASAPNPRITTVNNDANDNAPMTPSQRLFSLDDVDSPLRNPRSPPVPPAINLIPATPSGMTPSTEQEQTRGTSFDETDERPPRRSVSLVLKRALSRGRSTTKEYGPSASRSGGFLTRTLSLTRDMQRRALSVRRSDSIDRGKGIAFDAQPEEEDKLHPFWRPAHFGDEYLNGLDNDDNETYRYPPIDNRPRRNFSTRLKRTFAILPIDDPEDFYPATSDEGPDRRTVRRTPSGNLRVVKHRASLESLGRDAAPEAQRPYTAPEQHGHKLRLWRSLSLKGKGAISHESAAGRSEKRAFNIFPHIGDKIGEYGPHTIPRRLSERRREKRSNELRQMISAPREVRDGVGDVIRRTSYRDAMQARAD